MKKILHTWLLTLKKSLPLKRPLDGWHGWPQRQGRNFIQKSRKKAWKGSVKGKEKANYSEMQNLLSSHFISSGYHDAWYWMLQWISRHIFLLYFSFHPRNGCFLKTGTSGFSGKLLAFYHAFLCFHTCNSLIPRRGNARWLHSLLHKPTTELLQIPACVYVAHPPSHC